MEDNNIIKSIVPYICPHCKKDFFIELQTIPTMVSGILREEDVENAKESLKEKLGTLHNVKEEAIQALKDWVNKEDTILGPSDVDTIMENIKKQYEKQN